MNNQDNTISINNFLPFSVKADLNNIVQIFLQFLTYANCASIISVCQS